jgi:hypothetical protein
MIGEIIRFTHYNAHVSTDKPTTIGFCYDKFTEKNQEYLIVLCKKIQFLPDMRYMYSDIVDNNLSKDIVVQVIPIEYYMETIT